MSVFITAVSPRVSFVHGKNVLYQPRIECQMLRPDPKVFTVLLIALSIFCIGCIGGDVRLRGYGDMHPKAAVAALFEAYQRDDRLDYYMSGPETAPTALMGIDRRYRLESALWRRIDDPAPVLKELVTGMQSKAAEYNRTLFGFDIRDTEGRDIGDWYSVLHSRMPVKLLGEKGVMVYPPPNDIYERIGASRMSPITTDK
jgi:hypothetical protein